MNKRVGMIGLALAIALTGCSKTTDRAAAPEPEEQATEVVDEVVDEDADEVADEVTDEAADEELPAYATANDIVTGTVWQYAYAGKTDPVMEAITDQICSMQDKLVTPSEGMFPAVDIVKVIQKQNIVAYFAAVEVSSYELKGTKLIETSGFSGPMRFDVKQTDDGNFSVEKCEMAQDGEGRFDSIVAYCDGDKTLAKKLSERTIALQTKLGFIRDYVDAYDMEVTGIVEISGNSIDINATGETASK